MTDRTPGSKGVTLASFLGLGTADVVGISHGVTRTAQAVSWIGVSGALGLIATAVQDLRSDKPVEEKWDAASNLTWGQQGLLKLSSSSVALKTAIAFGVVGGVIQTGVGIARIRTGVRSGDRTAIKLGALDVGSGLLWLGWDVLALEAPLFIGSYVVVRVSREAYANRRDVARFASKTRTRAERVYDAWVTNVEGIAQQTVRDVEDGLEWLLQPTLGPLMESFRAGYREAGVAAEVAVGAVEVAPATTAD